MQLTQKGTQRIEVVIRKIGGGGEGSIKNANKKAPAEKPKTWRTTLTGSEDPKRVRRVLVTNMTHLLASAKQVTQQTLQYYIGGLGNMHGDQAYQDRAQRTLEVLQDTTGFASAVTMGAVYGSWGGPIGSIIGGTLGAINSGVSTGFKYMGRQREFNYKIFKEENSLQYLRARASINLTNGRLR